LAGDAFTDTVVLLRGAAAERARSAAALSAITFSAAAFSAALLSVSAFSSASLHVSN
jgi:hypothetical protein